MDNGGNAVYAQPIGDESRIYSLSIRENGGIYCTVNRRNEEKGRKICKGIGGIPDASNAYLYRLF